MSRRRRWPDPAPEFLSHTCQVRVRFQEVDCLNVVWHGHYVTYLEEGRNAFGREFELGYQDVQREGYIVPLVHVSLDYLAPARMGDVLTVTTRLHPDEAARVGFSYLIADSEGKTLATGRTVQAFTDLSGTLVLTRPRFFTEFWERWEARIETA